MTTANRELQAGETSQTNQDIDYHSSSDTSKQVNDESQFERPPQLPLSFISNRGPIETDKNDKLLTFIQIEKLMDNPEEMQPLEYKVVETVYNMDDDEFDSIDGDCKNNNKLLRQDLQSLDKNILDFYGVVLDFDEFGQQVAKTTKQRNKVTTTRNNQGNIAKSCNSARGYKKSRSISHNQEFFGKLNDLRQRGDIQYNNFNTSIYMMSPNQGGPTTNVQYQEDEEKEYEK